MHWQINNNFLNKYLTMYKKSYPQAQSKFVLNLLNYFNIIAHFNYLVYKLLSQFRFNYLISYIII